MIDEIVSNPALTRDDCVKLLAALLTPLSDAQSEGGARIKLGYAAAHSDPVASELEGFTRALWGLAPLLSQEPDRPEVEELKRKWVQGLKNGCDPSNVDEFWGWYQGINQRYVEMAAIGFSLAIAPGVFWDPLSDKAKQNLTAWLLGSNAQAFPENNWRFFRVLINLGLKRAGGEYDQQALDGALDMIETFYGDHGFPADGVDVVCKAYDYYATSFAIPFYSLIYTRIGEGERVERFKQRALQNLPVMVHLFDPDGAGIPFGRSMAYRFAMSSFFAAVAYADLDLPPPFTWGVVKGLLLRNIRWFTQNPAIFHRDGSLSVGYTTPNQFMSENYNCPQSPYWALKSFLVLALPEDHPFWAAKEQAYPKSLLRPVIVAKPWMQTFSHAGGHTYLLSSGQESFDHRGTDTKYGKFAYSSAFGFSVSTGGIGLDQLAPDNSLALSDDGERWVVRRRVTNVFIHDDGWIKSTWKWKDVTVVTWLLPPTTDVPYHTRVHKITSPRPLHWAEGGFAIHSMSGPERSQRLIPVVDTLDQDTHCRFTSDDSALAHSGAGVSGIINLASPCTARVLIADGNSNVITPWSVIPLLQGETTGETFLASRIFATPRPSDWLNEWNAAHTTLAEILSSHQYIN